MGSYYYILIFPKPTYGSRVEQGHPSLGHKLVFMSLINYENSGSRKESNPNLG